MKIRGLFYMHQILLIKLISEKITVWGKSNEWIQIGFGLIELIEFISSSTSCFKQLA